MTLSAHVLRLLIAVTVVGHSFVLTPAVFGRRIANLESRAQRRPQQPKIRHEPLLERSLRPLQVPLAASGGDADDISWEDGRGIHIEEAEEWFVDAEENLEEGEKLLKAVKSFDRGILLCAGALTCRTSEDGQRVYDLWLGDSIERGVGANLQIKGCLLALDVLFTEYLTKALPHPRPGTHLHVHCPGDTASKLAAVQRGFSIEEEASDTAESIQLWDEKQGVELYTRAALLLSDAAGGTPMRVLRALSRLTTPLEPSSPARGQSSPSFVQEDGQLDGCDFSLLRGALPLDAVHAIVDAAGRLSYATEPDTVDLFPSHHSSLVSASRPPSQHPCRRGEVTIAMHRWKAASLSATLMLPRSSSPSSLPFSSPGCARLFLPQRLTFAIYS